MQWYALALGSALLNALSSVTEKKTLLKEHAMEFATTISLFILALSLPLAFIADFTMPNHYWGILFIISIIDAVAFLYITKAVRHMELSESSPLFVYGPAITAILAFLFLKETLTQQRILGIACVTFGAYILEFKSSKKQLNLLSPLKVMMQSRYIHYLFFGLILYALSAVIARYLLNTTNPNHIDPYALLVINHFFIALIYVFLLAIFHDGIKGVQHGIKGAGSLIFLSAIFLFGSRILLTIAFTIPAAEVALTLGVRRLSSLFSTLLGGEIFHDKNISHKALACIIMIIGALLITLP
jgi:drug/metabolite transporter (DMT)-like permease